VPRVNALQIEAALRLLGLVDAYRITKAAVHRAHDIHAAESLMAAFKLRIDKVYRELALSAHPDRGGDEERMKALNTARDVLHRLQIVPPRPPRRPRRRVIRVTVIRRPQPTG